MRRNFSATQLMALLVTMSMLGSLLALSSTAADATAKINRTRQDASVHPRATAHCSNTRTLPTRANLRFVDTAILCLTDRERAHRGLRALQPNRNLQGLASSQARDMVIGDYFGDLDLRGQTPWQRISSSRYAADARSVAAAQNIGWGVGALATPAAMMSAWMRSPEHRQIVLTSSFRDIGIGVAPAAPHSLTDGMRGATYTVEFATRR